MGVSICTKKPKSQAELAQSWVDGVQAQGLETLVSNIQTQLKSFRLKDQVLPLTVNDSQWDNAYTCSPYTAYISYAREELDLIESKPLRLSLAMALNIAGGYLRLAQFNRVVQLNNWWVSTHEWPLLSDAQIQQMMRTLSAEYPSHALMMRGLNVFQHLDMMHSLEQQGFILMPARQVYLFDGRNPDHFWKRNNTKNDMRLTRKTELTLFSPEDVREADFPAIHRCFKALFIEKHSSLNPQFSEAYLRHMWAMGAYEFYGARDESGDVVAVVALWQQDQVMSAPILGYRTDLPKSLGLYRLMVALVLQQTKERAQVLNLSSGASAFKQSRGGKAEIEYTALYVNHLKPIRRTLLKGFARLLARFGAGFLQKHQL